MTRAATSATLAGQMPILICYDGSPAAERAVQAAARLFAGRRAVVLYVASPQALDRVRTTPVEAVRQELIEEVRVAAAHEAAAVAEAGADLARRAGLSARPLVVETGDGGVPKAIAQAAKNESASAIVVGRSHKRLGVFSPGSLCARLADQSATPVVVA